MGPFFLNSALIPFYFWFVGRLILLPCHYIAFAMISLNCACWASFGPVMYFSSLSSCCPAFLLGQFSYHLRHSLAHFISLGILDLLYSFGHLWPVPFLHSYGLLLNFLSFLDPITISFAFGVCWPLHQPPFTISFLWAPRAHLYLFSTSYDSHRLTTSFPGLPWVRLLSLGPFLLLYRLMNHYSCHSVLMVFLALLIPLPLPLLYCWASCYWDFWPKWASTLI